MDSNHKSETINHKPETIKESKLVFLKSEDCYQSLYKTFPGIEERAIRKKCDEFYDYCLSKGRTYKDYLAAVRNAVRNDQEKLPKKVVSSVRAVREEISEEQRMKNISVIGKMKEQLMGQIGGN